MRQKKKKKTKPRKPLAPAKFATDTQVRVKPGITVPDFEDIPLGGWSGTIAEVDRRSNPPTYLIEWDRRTLDAMHPVYRNRCERDGLGLENMWLGEDEIEPNTGEPLPIEQPAQIVTRPLRMTDQDDRIRAVFGLSSDDPLPEANEKTLCQYHRYLADHLTFPFDATYTREAGFMQDRSDAGTVGSLRSTEPADDMYGLFCTARHERHQIDVPLADIEVKQGNPNRQLVKDYSTWFVNNG